MSEQEKWYRELLAAQDQRHAQVALTEEEVHFLLNVTEVIELLPEDQRGMQWKIREKLKIALSGLHNS